MSLNLAGMWDALSKTILHPHPPPPHKGMTNLLAALMSKINYWLYHEGLLETGLLPPPAAASNGASSSGGIGGNHPRIVQRSTLHTTHFALDCATQVHILEHQIPEVEHMVHNRPLLH